MDSSKSSDVAWMKKVISSGTLSDKVAGLTVLTQDDLVHNLGCLETLINMVTTKGKRECLMALGKYQVALAWDRQLNSL
jgi:ribosome biogenesis protein MAK21